MYKAWFPLALSWLGFQDAVISVDPPTTHSTQGSFSARLLVAGPTTAHGPLTGFEGRWIIGDGLVLTTITVVAPHQE